MNIIGPDLLVFGVDDVAACRQFLVDYGLQPVGVDERGGRFVALDGTGVEIRHKDDPGLPPPLGTASALRQTVYGVADEATLEAIARELRRIARLRGSRTATEYRRRCRVCARIPGLPCAGLELAGERVNDRARRAATQRRRCTARRRHRLERCRTVYFVPDAPEARRSASSDSGSSARSFREHGSVPPTRGHAGSPHVVHDPDAAVHERLRHFVPPGRSDRGAQAGRRLGRRATRRSGARPITFGSNWFWYFNSPLGCHVEYDADMDLHDNEWVARETPISADASQMFLFKSIEKWMPRSASRQRRTRDKAQHMAIASRRLGLIGDFGRSRTWFDPGKDEEALFVVRQAKLHAYRDRCPHEGARLPWRRLISIAMGLASFATRTAPSSTLRADAACWAVSRTIARPGNLEITTQGNSCQERFRHVARP